MPALADHPSCCPRMDPRGGVPHHAAVLGGTPQGPFQLACNILGLRRKANTQPLLRGAGPVGVFDRGVGDRVSFRGRKLVYRPMDTDSRAERRRGAVSAFLFLTRLVSCPELRCPP